MTRWNLFFSDLQQFVKAIGTTCGDRYHRYRAIFAHKDKLVIMEPKVSTPGLNTLILKDVDESGMEILQGIATKHEMDMIRCDSVEGEERKELISSS